MILLNRMAKTNFKRAQIGMVTAILTASVMAPHIVMAEEAVSTPQTRPAAVRMKPAADRGFCARIENLESAVDKKFDERKAKLDTRRGERMTKLDERQGKVDARRLEHRSKGDANRTDHYGKLLERATTEAQKQAVENFKAAVEGAVAARKTAVDAAVQAFRGGLDQAIADRKAKVDTAVSGFDTARDAALAKAKADCAGDMEPKTARESYMQSMKAAREKLNADRKAIDILKKSSEGLITARKTAVETEMADFKAAIEKARQDLKAAFGQE